MALSEQKQYDLEQTAERSKFLAVLLGLLLPPCGYIYAGSWRWTAINVLTLNYMLLGFIIVPIHCYLMIRNSRKQLYSE